MIDPDRLNPPVKETNLLQELIIFAVCVAGKPALRTARLVDELLRQSKGDTPFERINHLIEKDWLYHRLFTLRFGQYTRIHNALRHVIRLDTADLTVGRLEMCPGVGPKTARFVMLYHKPELGCVPLDTHVLAFLRNCGYNAPQTTPQKGRRYRELEEAFRAEAKRRGMSVVELDQLVWRNARHQLGGSRQAMRKEPAEVRFWRKVQKTSNCWLWTGSLDTGGYGMFWPSSRQAVHAHRFAWLLTNGEFDRRLDVLHECDNPRCVRPSHLFLGTEHDNMMDMARKGRHGSAKLSKEQVRDVRRRVAAGESQRSVARDLGVSPAAICNLLKGKSYAHVD
jgi:hypothetical protein